MPWVKKIAFPTICIFVFFALMVSLEQNFRYGFIMAVRPILMQLDLPSVEKVPFSTFA